MTFEEWLESLEEGEWADWEEAARAAYKAGYNLGYHEGYADGEGNSTC